MIELLLPNLYPNQAFCLDEPIVVSAFDRLSVGVGEYFRSFRSVIKYSRKTVTLLLTHVVMEIEPFP